MAGTEGGRDWAYRVDPYGFERPDDFDYASYEAFFSRYLVVLTRRAIKWSKLIKGKNSIQKSLKVKRYIRKGIPNEHRALIWMIVSGAQANMEQNPGYYHRLLEGEKNDKLVEAIKTVPKGPGRAAGMVEDVEQCLCKADELRLHLSSRKDC